MASQEAMLTAAFAAMEQGNDKIDITLWCHPASSSNSAAPAVLAAAPGTAETAAAAAEATPSSSGSSAALAALLAAPPAATDTAAAAAAATAASSSGLAFSAPLAAAHLYGLVPNSVGELKRCGRGSAPLQGMWAYAASWDALGTTSFRNNMLWKCACQAPPASKKTSALGLQAVFWPYGSAALSSSLRLMHQFQNFVKNRPQNPIAYPGQKRPCADACAGPVPMRRFFGRPV